MKDAPAGTCEQHWEDPLRQEHNELGHLVAVCMKCPRKIRMCTATRYTESCTFVKDHLGGHRDEKGCWFQ